MEARETTAAWDLSETQRLIDHPAVRLLRSQNGALTLTFLHRAFKEHHTISVPESHLRARLENFLDEARENRPGAYTQTAADYLTTWCGTEQLPLKKFYSDEADEPVFELTTAADTLDSPIAPIPVLLSQLHHQGLDLVGGFRTPRSPLGGSVVFVGDQLPVPGQQSLGRDERGHFS
jgi:hypothetical protein